MIMRQYRQICVLLMLFAAGVASAAMPEREFIWQQANAQAAAAVTSNDWRRAAMTYQQLADAGVRNGPLFYNLGTAWLNAGEYAAAVSVLQRAEGYLGGRPDVVHNLKIALARRDGRDNVEWPWYRFVCAWHFAIPFMYRIQIAVASFWGIWASMILARLGWRRVGRVMLVLCLCLWGVFTSSCLATLRMEYQVRHVAEFRVAPAAQVVRAALADTDGIEPPR